MCLPPDESRSLTDLSAGELGLWLEAQGFRAAHAPRIIRRMFNTPGSGDSAGARLPRELEQRLQSAFPRTSVTLAQRQASADGTVKLLLRLHDGRTVEAVLMPDYHPDRASGCISSQVGCAMGCDFCATARTGFERNLTSGEIIGQFLAIQSAARAAGRNLRTLVFMGMGEPMLNLPNVIAAVQRIAAPGLGAFGWRQITISTVGIVPGINELREAGLGVHLAVSLHAPDDATRAGLLPMGRRFPVKDVLAAAEHYQASCGRITTIQYCLIEGVNDALAQARDLARLLAGRRMHVNLLRYNPTGPGLQGRSYAPSPLEQTGAFLTELRACGVVAHVRRARGPDIDAACGQLRRREAARESPP